MAPIMTRITPHTLMVTPTLTRMADSTLAVVTTTVATLMVAVPGAVATRFMAAEMPSMAVAGSMGAVDSTVAAEATAGTANHQ
jgi:hypothetical protein